MNTGNSGGDDRPSAGERQPSPALKSYAEELNESFEQIPQEYRVKKRTAGIARPDAATTQRRWH
jgi:hypothetical protein